MYSPQMLLVKPMGCIQFCEVRRLCTAHRCFLCSPWVAYSSVKFVDYVQPTDASCAAHGLHTVRRFCAVHGLYTAHRYFCASRVLYIVRLRFVQSHHMSILH
ncbi:hypothetical protein CEXT_415111 [Caerostris extrusa]|uniref:Secreted protein n=1 Tax=Caerostris extrusa TaxID=172846 RepID=A0AAV4NVM5_CAEEX|nr:hypothetical protein CEXT_415111 [Caerostris extrusa]